MRSNEMKEAELLRRYFLGELEAEASEDLERQLLADGELFELAEAVEGDLLAACARGELLPAERDEVLRRLAASPAGQARLALARDLTTLAAQEERPPAAVLPFRPPARPAQMDRPAARLAALAACLTLLVGGLWLAYRQTADLGHRAAEEQVAHEISQPPAPPPAVPTQETPPPTVPTSVPPVRPEPEKLAKHRPEGARSALLHISYEIALATTRSAAATPPPLVLQEGAGQADIRIVLGRADIYPTYRTVLTSASGEKLLEKLLTARTGDDPPAVTLFVPASLLVPGTYRVEVWGLPSGEEEEDLGEKTFEVKSS